MYQTKEGGRKKIKKEKKDRNENEGREGEREREREEYINKIQLYIHYMYTIVKTYISTISKFLITSSIGSIL